MVNINRDDKGCYAQWGEAGQKYYYACGNKDAQERARARAYNQGQAVIISEGNKIHKILDKKKYSFDFDGVLTQKGNREIATELINKGQYVYIISARTIIKDLLVMADKLRIPHSRVFALGTQKNKVAKIQELKIDQHTDSNPQTVKTINKTTNTKAILVSKPITLSEQEFYSVSKQSVLKETIAELNFITDKEVLFEFATAKQIDPNTTFYYYTGPLDEKTREFCAFMLLQGKFYSDDEMDYLSDLLGYDVYLYLGSFNCRHNWVRARIKGLIQSGNLNKTLIAKDGDASRAAAHQSENLIG